MDKKKAKPKAPPVSGFLARFRGLLQACAALLTNPHLPNLLKGQIYRGKGKYVSSVYHGLIPSLGKKVMQVIDHCTIYTLIAGTYTPIALCALRPAYPRLAWSLLAAEWGTAAVATVFSAIDHKKFHAVEMTAYLVMGWLCVAAYRPVVECLSREGFGWLLAGGVAYTLGAVLYGLGRKKNPIYHTVFHVFVDIGSILHAVCVLCYVL